MIETKVHPLDTVQVCAICNEPLPRDERGHVRYSCLDRYDERIQWPITIKVCRPCWQKAVVKE